MQDYNNQKKNPDPAIAKVRQEKVQKLPDRQTEAENQAKEFELPKLNEIPEIRDSEPVMEIL